jgi:hypothetical protein
MPAFAGMTKERVFATQKEREEESGSGRKGEKWRG